MTGGSGARPSDKVLRFKRSERLVHWGLAIPYVVCLATAAVLIVFYNLSPDRPYRAVASWAHRAGGVALIALPILALAGSPRELRLHFQNVRQAWSWTLKDLKWLALMGVAAVTRRVRLPDQGKFNAGEKLNFMTVMISYPIFIATGIIMWLPGAAVLSWIIHVALALAVSPIVIGHVYMAVLNPGTRKGLPGMVSGYVDREWAKEHYRDWYSETYGIERETPGRAAERSDRRPETLAPSTRFGADPHNSGAEPPTDGSAVRESRPA